MKKELRFLVIFILLLTFVGCSTTKMNSNGHSSSSKVSDGIFFAKDDIKKFINVTKKKHPQIIDETVYITILDALKDNVYNKALKKNMENSILFEEAKQNFSKIAHNPISQKIAILKMKRLDQSEVKKYISSFHKIKDAEERMELIEKIVSNTFVDNHNLKFLVEVAMLMISQKREFQNATNYNNILANFKIHQLKVNLYVFKNVKTEDLKKIISLQESEEWLNGSSFLNRMRKLTNEMVIKKVHEEFKRKNINILPFNKQQFI